jgi:hypothetical protein
MHAPQKKTMPWCNNNNKRTDKMVVAGGIDGTRQCNASDICGAAEAVDGGGEWHREEGWE